jgi:hypothetical protein
VRGRQFLSRSSVLSNLLDDNVSELSENDTLCGQSDSDSDFIPDSTDNDC